MIDNTYWSRIAKEWKKKDDGIVIPEIDSKGVSEIDPDADSDSSFDKEIDDILSDLGLDDL